MKMRVIVFVALAVCLLAVSSAQAHVTFVAYDPCCAPPVAFTAYYVPAPAVMYPPAAVVRSRYRPLRGGSVTRVRYVTAPAAYASPWYW